MAGTQLRVYRRRIKTVQSTKKITRAMELIAASRILRATQRLQAHRPYGDALLQVVSDLVSQSTVVHPLETPRENPRRAGVIVSASDRGLAGGYNAGVFRAAQELSARLRAEGKEVVPFLIGRKTIAYYKFRGIETERSWSGFTDRPDYSDMMPVADEAIRSFLAGEVDEVYGIFTQFRNQVNQAVVVRRSLPIRPVEEQGAAAGLGPAPQGVEERRSLGEDAASRVSGPVPLYEFEPDTESLLNGLLTAFVRERFYYASLHAAASEHAARQRAMKAATDNAEELTKTLTRAANAARQAEITQEIMEIVGGAEAMSHTGSE